MAYREFTPPGGGILEMRPPPPELARFILGFVHRDEKNVGGVVRVLPELRASIQIQTFDPYWVRGRRPLAIWERTPRVALWAPRFEWGFGFAAQHIRAFAIGLTPVGFQTITREMTALLLNRVFDLHAFNTELASKLDPLTDESFDAWIARIVNPLRMLFISVPPSSRTFDNVLHILATAEGGAVARSASEAGFSERQFRRVFTDHYGVCPKRYQRTLRVDRMVRQLHPVPWEKDAYEDALIPFADQSHAIREFREMTGATPEEYVLAKRGGDRTLRSIAVEDVMPPSDSDANASMKDCDGFSRQESPVAGGAAPMAKRVPTEGPGRYSATRDPTDSLRTETPCPIPAAAAPYSMLLAGTEPRSPSDYPVVWAVTGDRATPFGETLWMGETA